MLATIFFWLGLAVSVWIGFLYFRDLGDASQLVIKVKRENTLRFIRNEYQLLAIGIGAAAVMALTHLLYDAGPRWLFLIALPVIVILYGFPYVWVHLGLRNQMRTAKYFPIEEAQFHVNPATSVLVIEHNGVARAHPDYELMRPHLAGDDDGLAGANVIMTYCAMANLGLGYSPEIDSCPLQLEVMAQHGNNLILRDNTTAEPIQQIYGYRESEGGSGMEAWPTFRMSFRAFRKAYPDGKVFLNKPSANPLLRLFDMVMDMVLTNSISQHHREDRPIMDNMSREDPRLLKKTYIWGINVGDDATCYTQDFLFEQDNLVNATIGGRRIVVAWDPLYESLGAWYNDGDAPVTKIDFFGDSDQGKLRRVETLKPGMFWHVWAEYFPHTDINRVDS